MNLGLFKSIVNGEIREMVEDVTQASGRLEAAGASVQADRRSGRPRTARSSRALLRLP